jgi:hypothetical protein
VNGLNCGALSHPEKAQKIILQRLGIDLPRRMRIPDFVSKYSGDF